MSTFTVALDWTPNTIHTGIFVALSKGYYSDRGLEVKVRSPHVDDYKATPAQLVQNNQADICFCPKETVLSHSFNPDVQQRLVSVASALQKNDSAIVTLKSSGIDTVAKLDGKKYGSYAARYEGRIVQQLIKKGGGTGEYQEVVSPMLKLYDELVKGNIDATWVFMGWEGVLAEHNGVELNCFKLSEHLKEYGHAPKLATTNALISLKADELEKFLTATKLGYEYATMNAEECAKILVDASVELFKDSPIPEPLDLPMVVKSQIHQNANYVDSNGQWGTESAEEWKVYVDWLSSTGMLTTKKQSRHPDNVLTVSLDDLRSGNAGEAIPREDVDESKLVKTIIT